jgi:hypothetical protein
LVGGRSQASEPRPWPACARVRPVVHVISEHKAQVIEISGSFCALEFPEEGQKLLLRQPTHGFSVHDAANRRPMEEPHTFESFICELPISVRWCLCRGVAIAPAAILIQSSS